MMYVFGGFEKGARTNSTLMFDLATHTWHPFKALTAAAPVPRAGHSACVFGDCMYVFGGKDDENEKLRDLWRLNFSDMVWVQMESPEQAVASRSGHSCCIYRDNIIIFGGIQEITKELDDCLLYNIGDDNWVQLFGATKDSHLLETSSKLSNGSANKPLVSLEGARLAGSHTKVTSPTKTSPSKFGKHSLGTNSLTAPSQAHHKKKKKDAEAHDDIELDDPTSVSLMNSILIQPHGATFDNYVHMLKQQKRGRHPGTLGYSGMTGASPTRHYEAQDRIENTYGKVQHRRPAARDGHSGLMYGDSLVIFGGDRHHMPFNDIFMLEVAQEFDDR
jgi:hypothetical protein